MSGALGAALAVLGTTATSVVWVAIGDMVGEKARRRLHRLPFVLVRLAAARLPRDLRDDLTAEWNAQLEFVVSETGGMPLTRLARGICYSASLLLSAGAVADGLTGRKGSASGNLGRAVVLGVGALPRRCWCLLELLVMVGAVQQGLTAMAGTSPQGRLEWF